MKGTLRRQVQAMAAVSSPGLMHRLMSIASAAECNSTVFLNGVRGMATGADSIIPRSSKKQASIPERGIAQKKAELVDKRPTVSASPENTRGIASNAAGASMHLRWWRPDPVTGTWVPKGSEGHVTTSTESMKAPSRSTRIRSESTESVEEDKNWWTSMEELPDMDRLKDM